MLAQLQRRGSDTLWDDGTMTGVTPGALGGIDATAARVPGSPTTVPLLFTEFGVCAELSMAAANTSTRTNRSSLENLIVVSVSVAIVFPFGRLLVL